MLSNNSAKSLHVAVASGFFGILHMRIIVEDIIAFHAASGRWTGNKLILVA